MPYLAAFLMTLINLFVFSSVILTQLELLAHIKIISFLVEYAEYVVFCVSWKFI